MNPHSPTLLERETVRDDLDRPRSNRPVRSGPSCRTAAVTNTESVDDWILSYPAAQSDRKPGNEAGTSIQTGLDRNPGHRCDPVRLSQYWSAPMTSPPAT